MDGIHVVCRFVNRLRWSPTARGDSDDHGAALPLWITEAIRPARHVLARSVGGECVASGATN